MYNPCYYRDINYNGLLDEDSYEELLHRDTSNDQIKACTSWQFNTSEFGDTITSEVNVFSFFFFFYIFYSIIIINIKRTFPPFPVLIAVFFLLNTRIIFLRLVELGLRPERIEKLCRDDVFDGRGFRRFLLRARVRQVSPHFYRLLKRDASVIRITGNYIRTNRYGLVENSSKSF